MKIVVDNKFSALIDPDKRQWQMVAKLLTFRVPGAEHTPQYKLYGWDGKKCLMNPIGMFPTGWISAVIKRLESVGLMEGVEIEDRRSFHAPLEHIDLQGIDPAMKMPELDLIQDNAVEAFLANKRGLIKAATGSGKTEMGVQICGRVLLNNDRTGIWLTNNKELLYQTVKRFKARLPQLNVGVVGDNQWEPGKLTVATVQTLNRALKVQDQRAHDLLYPAVLHVYDEAHLACSPQWQNVINACGDNAAWRLGLTATPELRDELDNAVMRGVTGEIIYEITARQLIDLGLLAEPHIEFLPINDRSLPKRFTWQEAYEEGIVRSEERNMAVCRRALEYHKEGLLTVVMVIGLNHGRILGDTLGAFCKAEYVSGKDNSKKRLKALSNFADGKIDILVSSTILDTGVDIPEIGGMVLAGGQKSSIRTYQRVGRGMRRMVNKRIVKVTDFIDTSHKHLLRHSMQRLADCKAEEGYVLSYPDLAFAA